VIDFDFELRAHHERLRAAAAIGRGDRVLDIGCGTGQSTRDAARAADPGRVLGVDVSAASLERARERTAAARLENVTYEHGDAQTHPFAPGGFDVAISRFGVMFFSDPLAAFANVARALRPDGRLVLLVWQPRERNAWASAIDGAICGPVPPPAPAATSDAFSLGDAAATGDLLARAGFGEIHFEDVREPVFYGPDTATALDWVRGFQSTREALAALPGTAAARAVRRLRETLDEHRTARDGVSFDSRAWLITARGPRDQANMR
jgi:SAM-dependent methyltransferase